MRYAFTLVPGMHRYVCHGVDRYLSENCNEKLSNYLTCNLLAVFRSQLQQKMTPGTSRCYDAIANIFIQKFRCPIYME